MAVDGTIKIYPKAEMKAIDMAELMKVIATFDGVIQGCQMELTNGVVKMTPGRILIGGRLAAFEGDPEVDAGKITIPAPTNIAGQIQIVAVCDLSGQLSATYPMYVQMCKPSELQAIQALAETFTDETFNVETGVKYVTLAIASVQPNGTVTAISYPQNGSAVAIRSNKKYVDEKSSNTNATVTKNKGIFDLWLAQIKRRWHKRSNFVTYVAQGDGIQIAANTSKVFKFRKEYGTVVSVLPSGSGSAVHTNEPFIDIRADGTIVAEGAGQSTPVAQTYDNTYGTSIPTNVNDEKVHFGIIGVAIDNASSGGTGSANCVLQAFYTEGNYVCARIRNTGSSAAKLKLGIRSLYVVNPDF